MRRYFQALACGFFLALGGCGMLKEAMDDCRTTSTAIKTELGVDATCSFANVNGHTTVTVRLMSVPAGPASALKTEVTDVTRRSFHASVDAVLLVL
jgi:hypothetical protein